MRVQRFLVGEAHRGQRLDLFVQAMIPRMSRSAIALAIYDRRIHLGSGVAAKASRRLLVGEEVIVRPRETVGELPPRPPVLLQGAGWCVIDKPAGLATTPAARRPGADVASLCGLAPAHRLDRFTSGCLLLTGEPAAARHFVEMFSTGRVRKEYAAVVVGEPARDSWTRETALAPDPGSRVPGRMREAGEKSREGGGARLGQGDARPALTRFEVVARGQGVALVRAQPVTGRRHQVRVHAAGSGHPLVGDLLYGGDERDFVRLQLGQAAPVPAGLAPGRFLLHARALASEAPDGVSFEAVSPWPADFPLDLALAWGTIVP